MISHAADSDNVVWRGERERDFAASTSWFDGLRLYYGADDQLALSNRHGGLSAVSDDSRPGSRGVWEMHRYDALGRRVMTHAVRGSSCPVSATECASVVERTVWDGDQLFYEIRTPYTTPDNDQPAGGTYHAYGRVAYLHAGAIDAPLAVTRMDLSGQPAEVTVAPHAGWQGSYVGGSLMNGASQESCTGASGCPLIDWPGAVQTTDGLAVAPSGNAWWGKLIAESADGSGLKYQRNRFYDPTTGQFTQQDPIGLSGGVNLYAFAGGDPVNFRDPFGLCPNPLAYGLGSLQCALEDMMSAVRAAPSIFWNAVSAPSAKRDLVVGLAQTPFWVVGAGEKAAARAVVPLVGDAKLANLVGDLYKGARGRNVIGTGSTADAIRFERATGQAVGGRFHSQKGEQYVRALENWLGKNPNASSRDQLVARSILDDLRSALGGR